MRLQGKLSCFIFPEAGESETEHRFPTGQQGTAVLWQPVFEVQRC